MISSRQLIWHPMTLTKSFSKLASSLGLKVAQLKLQIQLFIYRKCLSMVWLVSEMPIASLLSECPFQARLIIVHDQVLNTLTTLNYRLLGAQDKCEISPSSKTLKVWSAIALRTREYSSFLSLSVRSSGAPFLFLPARLNLVANFGFQYKERICGAYQAVNLGHKLFVHSLLFTCVETQANHSYWDLKQLETCLHHTVMQQLEDIVEYRLSQETFFLGDYCYYLIDYGRGLTHLSEDIHDFKVSMTFLHQNLCNILFSC